MPDNTPITSRLFQQAEFVIPDPAKKRFVPMWRCRRFALDLQCANNQSINVFLFSPYEIQLQSHLHISLPVLYMFGDVQNFDLLSAKDFMEERLMDKRLLDKEVLVLPTHSSKGECLDTKAVLQELQDELLRPLDLIPEDIAHLKPRKRKTSLPNRPLPASDFIHYYPRMHLQREERVREQEEITAPAQGRKAASKVAGYEVEEPTKSLAGQLATSSAARTPADGDVEGSDSSTESEATAQQLFSPPKKDSDSLSSGGSWIDEVDEEMINRIERETEDKDATAKKRSKCPVEGWKLTGTVVLGGALLGVGLIVYGLVYARRLKRSA